MKILITGINGFIGGAIGRSLMDNHQVLGIDMTETSENCSIYEKVDITSQKKIDEFLEKNTDIDIVIHSAALAHNKGNDLSFEKFKKVNYEGTTYLVNGSNKFLGNLKKFIFFSTISIYGEKLEVSSYTEDSSKEGATPYAMTKRMSEEYLNNTATFNYTILRFAPVYSKEFTLNIDRRTLIKNKLYKVGSGINKLSLCNVKNIVKTIEFFVNNFEKGNKEAYNIADRKVYSFLDLLKLQQKQKNQKIKIYFPKALFQLSYIAGKIIGNKFLLENSIKLISDNVYDTSKISKLVDLNYHLQEE